MSNIPQTIAAFALSIENKDLASKLFTLARVCAGFEMPTTATFHTLYILERQAGPLPEYLPGSGVHRRSFAKRAGHELVRRVFDMPKDAPDFAGLIKLNARLLLGVLDNLPLAEIAKIVQPKAEERTLAPDFSGTNGPVSTLNEIHLPGMTLRYAPTSVSDWRSDAMRTEFEISLLFEADSKHPSNMKCTAQTKTREEACAMMQLWITDPSSALENTSVSTSVTGVSTSEEVEI